MRQAAPATKTTGPDKVIPVNAGSPPAALLKPEAASGTAPATFKAVFDTTKGKFVIEAHRDWSPTGVDRFYHLIKIGYFDNVAFFRIKKDFMVQFGIHGHPKVNAAWSKAQIKDDPPKGSNTRGMVTFAKTGLPNSRTTQIFVNYGNNIRLDGMGFAPFGKIVDGMKVLDALYDGYGLALGNQQGRIQSDGNAFLAENYPKVDYINTVTIQ
jgi:peptidyl-prolyl cis-trans isomerase A (cyclophilin A)